MSSPSHHHHMRVGDLPCMSSDPTSYQSVCDSGNLRRPKLPIPMASVTKSTQDDEAPEAIEFKTIRRGRVGPIASPLNRDELGKWQTIAEVMVD